MSAAPVWAVVRLPPKRASVRSSPGSAVRRRVRELQGRPGARRGWVQVRGFEYPVEEDASGGWHVELYGPARARLARVYVGAAAGRRRLGWMRLRYVAYPPGLPRGALTGVALLQERLWHVRRREGGGLELGPRLPQR